MRALSQAPFALALMQGPAITGVSLGHGHLLFAGRVLSLTLPGELRMPNGVEAETAMPGLHAPVQIGGGRLEFEGATLVPGPLWDPRPRPRFAISTRPSIPLPEVVSLVGRGPGLTPLGDDLLIGYLGARALSGASSCDNLDLAGSLAARTTSLSGTLLRLAARGHLPEAAHRLLEDGDPEPLRSWGATSGSGLLAGIGLHGAPAGDRLVRTVAVALPLEPARHLQVAIHAIRVAHPFAATPGGAGLLPT